MQYYEDLLSLPFEINGRFGKTEGIDCYGLVLEMTRRAGKPLNDVVYPTEPVPLSDIGRYSDGLNLKEITEEEADCGDIIQCEYEGNLHVAYMLSRNLVIHATFNGVRISPLLYLKNKKYMRVY